jgi:hypothetical protein
MRLAFSILFVSSAVLAAPMAAAPIATANDDIDGDGAKDAIELGKDGTLTLGKKSVKLAASAHTGRVEVGRFGGKAIVLAVVDDKGFVIAPTASGWKAAIEFPVGGVGLDADYEIDATATPRGIIRYQKRQGIRRCDGKPALVFAEGFDGRRTGRIADSLQRAIRVASDRRGRCGWAWNSHGAR